MSHDPFVTVYDRGAAVCETDIRKDVMVCRFRDEVFEMPIVQIHPHVQYNGYFYEIPIDKLRELEREHAG